MKAEFFLQKIKEEFPEVKWEHHHFLTHGWDHLVIVLDNKMIFRAPKDVPKDLQSELFDEIQLLHYLKKKVKVGIPEYNYVSKDKSLAGYKMLSGRELKPSQFKRFTASEKEKFAKQIADFLTSLHAIPKSAVTKYHVRIDNPQKDFEWFVSNTKKLLFPRLSKKEVQIIESYFDELKVALSHTYSNALVHNDLTWEHILWHSKNEQVNIIDFSDRAFGDPASDFAGLWEFGSKLTNRVYDLYHGKKDDTLLYRSQLYFKRIPLFIMKDALDGYPCTFKEGYEMFKKRFKIAKIS